MEYVQLKSSQLSFRAVFIREKLMYADFPFYGSVSDEVIYPFPLTSINLYRSELNTRKL